MCSEKADRPDGVTGYFTLSKVWFLVILAFTLPAFMWIPAPGIDCSWLIGLNMALSRGMQFGKDIVFTFGPPGFLYLPIFCDITHWIIACFCGLLIHFVLVLLVFLLLQKIAGSRLCFIIGSASLLFILPFLTIDYKLILIALLLLNSTLMFGVDLKWSWLTVGLMSLCLALASSIKFSAAICSAGLIGTAALIFSYQRQFLNLASMVLFYLIVYGAIWILTGQHIANLIPYLRNSMELSAGYSQAMALSGEKLQLAAGAAGICFFYMLFAYGVVARKQGLTIFMLPFLVFAFVTFKHGFVRQDWMHVYVFFASMLFLFGWIYLAHKQSFPKVLRVLLLMLCGVMASFTIIQSSNVSQSMSVRFQSNIAALKAIFSGLSYMQNLLNEYKQNLRDRYRLSSQEVEYIGQKRMDIFPGEVTMLYAYNMNWSARPVFQSYSAYTKALDLLNADYYAKNPPDMLFYGVMTIDNRYAVFDEPATFRQILLNYKPLLGITLFEKKTQSTTFERHTISAGQADIGETIKVPQSKGYLFANITIEYSLLGKLATIIYRGDQMHVHLATDEKPFDHRFIPSTAQNGIFLSSYIADNQDLASVLGGRHGNTIRSLKFTTGKKWFYKDKIKIEFFEIKPS